MSAMGECAVTRREPPRVLLVEDDLATAIVHSFMLKTRGFTVTLAESGEQALARVGQIRPDLVLLDLMLPGIDGYEVARALAKSGETAHIPVVVVTGQSRRFVGVPRPGNVVEYLHKPCDQEGLVAGVEGGLRRIGGS